MSNTVINPYNFVVGNVGGWKEVGRTTLGSSGDTISVTSIPDKMYYMMLGNYLPSGNFRTTYRINNDSAGNYALRKSEDGGAENVTTSITDMTVGNEDTNTAYFDVSYLQNISAQEKLMLNHNMRTGGSGVGSAPKRVEAVAKWANTSSVINRIDAVNDQGGDFATGSECVVLGYDPTDTHTTADNFWQELASVDWSSGSSIDSGTFTAKKYLWVQIVFNTGTMSGSYSGLQVGNSTIDTGSSYAFRYSEDGGADSLQTTKTSAWGAVGIGSDSSNSLNFSNHFIVNNALNEKLGISHSVINRGDTGSGFAPYRVECVWKWTDTSNQINRIEVSSQAGSGNYTSGIMKVWGSD
jgi:hypothetical protein